MRALSSLRLMLFCLLVMGGTLMVTLTSCAKSGKGEVMRSAEPSSPNYERLDDQPALLLPLKDPRIVVYKHERRLELYSDGKAVRTFRIGLGSNPIADKEREGDRATPEGEFYIFVKNPKSNFYLSLGISYPNLEDAERGLRDGLITRAQYNRIANAIKRRVGPPQYTPLGGLIYIHGNGAKSDWTWGCVALEDEHMKELYDSVEVGTPITIKP